MKKLLFILMGLSICTQMKSQNVGINKTGADPDPSAGLEINFSDKGFLLPRMTTAERNAISSPALGLQIFNTTDNCLQIYISGQWINLGCACDPPVAPAATAATNVGSTSLDANWSASTGAITYNLWVDDNSDFSSPIAGYGPKTGLAGTTETVSSLTSGVTYYYRVQAVNSCGTGGNSNTISATTLICPTWSDPFTSDNWVDVGTENFVRVNTTNNNIEFSTLRRVDPTATCFDLQTILGAGNFADQNGWILRFQVNWTDLGQAHHNVLYVGLFSQDCAYGTFTSQDGIYFSAVPFDNNWGVESCDGGTCSPGNATAGAPTAGTTYFIELIRDSQTSASISISMVGYGVTPILIDTETIAASLQDLRYIKVSNFDDQHEISTANPGIGTVDDVQFCNGLTSW